MFVFVFLKVIQKNKIKRNLGVIQQQPKNMEPEKKYVMANIRLPIELYEDGNYHLHSDRIHMEFEKCDELPPISENVNILERIKSILIVPQPREEEDQSHENSEEAEKEEEKTNEDLQIFPSEIKKKEKTRQNITFRNYHSKKGSNNNNTKKYRG